MKKIIGMRSGERWRLLAIPIALMVYIGFNDKLAGTLIPASFSVRSPNKDKDAV